MRTHLSTGRSLLAASTLLLVASSLTLLAADDVSAARSSDSSGWVRFKYYSDPSHTTQVGQCDYNIQCIQGYYRCSGVQTSYSQGELINYCSF
jgi:hypothetical protein